jgi:hypothetical protein
MRRRSGALWALLAGSLLALATGGGAQEGFFGPQEAALRSAFIEQGPCVSFDGTRLYYGRSAAPGSLSEFGLAVATWDETAGQFLFDRMLDEVNTHDLTTSPWISRDGKRLYFSATDWAGGGSVVGWKLYMAILGEGDRFHAIVPIASINNQIRHAAAPSLTEDECEIYFHTFVSPTSARRDMAMATREDPSQEFGTITFLSEINTEAYDEEGPSISADGMALFWSGHREPPGGYGGTDLWWATRPARFDGEGNPVPFRNKQRLPAPPNTAGHELESSICLGWPAAGAAIYFKVCWEESGDCDIYRARWHTYPAFRRGDANTDGGIDSADAMFVFSYLFANGPAPPCLDAADANDGGVVDLGDGIYTLQHFFANGPAMPPPYPLCGSDPTPDGIVCAAYSDCE